MNVEFVTIFILVGKCTGAWLYYQGAQFIDKFNNNPSVDWQVVPDIPTVSLVNPAVPQPSTTVIAGHTLTYFTKPIGTAKVVNPIASIASISTSRRQIIPFTNNPFLSRSFSTQSTVTVTHKVTQIITSTVYQTSVIPLTETLVYSYL